MALLLAVSAAISIQSCSLRFAANGTLPDSAKTIYVDNFINATRVPGVNDQYTIALKQQIAQHDRLEIVNDKTGADLVLSGRVLYFGTSSKTSNSVAEPLQYGDTMSVEAKLVSNDSGKILWSSNSISSSVSVPVVSQAIVPTTPQFLRQNLRGSDLVNMPDLQVAATQQSVAGQQLMSQAANELYTDMVWGL
ncbi:MAG: LPS assembly lipoprotein LptE [Candidatus Binataceae bacterium]